MLPLLSSKSGTPLSVERPRSSRGWSATSLRSRCSVWNMLGGSCLALSFLTLLYVMFEVMTGSWGSQLEQLQHHIRTSGNAKQRDVLVMYIFSNTDPQYLNNLKFFVHEGVHDGDGCEYIFVINRSADEEVVELPALPSNARYVLHNNECYDWGTFGWALMTQDIDVNSYKYFIFMNSSVRGPYIPSYLRGRVHWADVLFSKLNDQVKLVGPTINCEGSPLSGNVAGTWRRNPHVQSYVVATDRVGMHLLLTDPGVFQCYDNMWDTIYYSELGSSAAILDAGYNIDSLMVRYQGVDWRRKENWGCNLEKNPYGNHYLDGGSLEAMEVMFVKVKQRLLDHAWTYPLAAHHYDRWIRAHDLGAPDIMANDYVTNTAEYRLPVVVTAALKGLQCFDCDYYRETSQDLPAEFSCTQLFEHYINNGQFEGRTYRMKCLIPSNELMPFHPGPDFIAAMPHVSAERLEELKGEHEARMIEALPDNGLGAEAANAYVAHYAPTALESDEDLRSLPILRGMGPSKRALRSVARMRSGLTAAREGGSGMVVGVDIGGVPAQSIRHLSTVVNQANQDMRTAVMAGSRARVHRQLGGTQYMDRGTQDLVLR